MKYNVEIGERSLVPGLAKKQAVELAKTKADGGEQVMDNYLELAQILEEDITAQELKGRYMLALNEFAADAKKYGSAERAETETDSGQRERTYFCMLEGYALRLAGERGYTDTWTASADAVRVITENL